ncbi:gag-pol polyprotein [Tanacetum coccineum]
MAETMKQYMSKTQADYGSGIARPKFDDKDSFELKRQFLKELCDKTFGGSNKEDANDKYIEKVLGIVDLFHIPNITQDQVMLRAFPMSLTGAASPWLRNKPSGSITTWEDLKTKFLNKYCPPARTANKIEDIKNFQQEPDETLYQAWERFKELLMKCSQHYLTEMQETAANAKVAIQEMAEYSQKWHNGTSRTRSTKTFDGLAAIQAQLNNHGREIKKVIEKVYAAQVGSLTDAAVRNQGALVKTLEIQIGQISKVLQARGFGSLPSSTETNPRDHVKSILTTAEADSNLIRRIGSPPIRRASISVRPLSTYLNLGLGELAHTKLTVELADRTVKYPKGITENMLVGIGKFLFPVGFIILDMPEDVKVPLILGRPFLPTVHAKIDVFKRKITLRVGDEKIIFKSVKPASSLIRRVYILSLRERMGLDLEARLMGETLVLNRSLDPLYRDYIELNDLNVPLELRRDQVDDLMSTIKEGEVIDEPMIDIIKTRNNESFDEEFYNSIIRDKVELKRKNVVKAFMNVPIFVRIFSVVTHFVVVENMDGYRDQDMGDIILGEPFCKASCVEAKRFDRLITIHNGGDNMTYQMARSHLRFKHLSNAQCNKIKPLLKVSLHDKLNEISHPYQNLKSFYKGVLNLGPEYVRDAKMEEWLTCRHISVHEDLAAKKLTKLVKYQSSGILCVIVVML